MDNFVTASKLFSMMYSAYQAGRNDAIDKVAAAIPHFFNEQRHD
jgi:hypothetical protein